jgi:hypothetical protein
MSRILSEEGVGVGYLENSGSMERKLLKGEQKAFVIRRSHGVKMSCEYGRENVTAKDDAEVSRSQSELT